MYRPDVSRPHGVRNRPVTTREFEAGAPPKLTGGCQLLRKLVGEVITFLVAPSASQASAHPRTRRHSCLERVKYKVTSATFAPGDDDTQKAHRGNSVTGPLPEG